MHNKGVSFLILAAALTLTFEGIAQNQPFQPATIEGATSRVYKTIDDAELVLHIFQPPVRGEGELLPAIVFFFGGGWTNGTVNQFVPHCRYLAERGMIAIVADYRVRSRHGVTPYECVNDAKSAIRWLRIHADEYGIDASRIAASGGSAGGHLAASTALVRGYDETSENLSISSVPNALVLFNPALDMKSILERRSNSEGQENLAKKAEDISPLHHIRENAPPTIIFHGTNDTTVPISQAEAFCETMKKNGNRCELVAFEGRSHGFFNYRDGSTADYLETLRLADAFLVSIGYLK